MNKTELIKDLRELTQAGMKDCNDALREAGYDLQKAVDIIKTKGKNIVSGRSGKIASEGLVAVSTFKKGHVMVEVNCQTDFVANSPEFENFVKCTVVEGIVSATNNNQPFDVISVENERSALVARTKENIVIRRWWAEEAISPLAITTYYLHSNSKIGVLITVLADNENMLTNQETFSVAEGLAMQVAAMNPIAISPEHLPPEVVARQRAIFETQLKEANKPEVAWPKILEGKFNKWYTEVCLLNQESIMVPKKTVKQFLEELSSQLGGPLTVVNFIRCQVGEGIEKPQEDFANEVAKLV